MLGRRIALSILVLPGIALGWLAAPRQQAPVRLLLPDRPSGIYALGERVGWTMTAPDGEYKYTVRKNNQVPIASGELRPGFGRKRIEVVGDEPGMLYVELTPAGGKPVAYGAVVAPERLRPVAPRPRAFDAFWRRKISELRAIPENPVLTPGESGKPGVEYATIRMDHVNGTHVHGQIAKPAKPGKYPAMLVLQWASPPYRLWSPWVADRAAEGWLALNIQPHNVLPTEPQAYYDALPAALKNYHTIGQDDRERNYFVEMYLRGVRAVDYLSKHPNWDGRTIVVTGTSMGGQQSFAVAGLHPKVTHMVVHVPAGADLNASLHGRQLGYPSFDMRNPRAVETARYVDAINFAPRIRATSLVSMGFVDTITPPAGIWTAFNLIRGPKEVAPMVDAPHNNLATAEQQRPYTDRASEWFRALVRGERVVPRKSIPR